MIVARRATSRPTGNLPPVRGRYTENAPLGHTTWFRVGGPAEVVFRPADTEDLQAFFDGLAEGIPVTPLGVASNVLVRDAGIAGVVIRLGRGFGGISRDGDALVAGAAALCPNLALSAMQAELGGLEFLSGVPGSLGGALRMNAGAFGGEIKDVLDWAEAVDPAGGLHRLSCHELQYGYRHSGLPEGWVFVRARLRGTPGDAEAIRERVEAIRSAREESQPLRTRTGGSTFKNPTPPGAEGPKAWELIDAAGCRGLRRGGAMVSEKHCNFLVNTGSATAGDLEALGEEVRERVQSHSGVSLEWEIKRLGIRPGGAA